MEDLFESWELLEDPSGSWGCCRLLRGLVGPLGGSLEGLLALGGDPFGFWGTSLGSLGSWGSLNVFGGCWPCPLSPLPKVPASQGPTFAQVAALVPILELQGLMNPSGGSTGKSCPEPSRGRRGLSLPALGLSVSPALLICSTTTLTLLQVLTPPP